MRNEKKGKKLKLKLAINQKFEQSILFLYDFFNNFYSILGEQTLSLVRQFQQFCVVGLSFHFPSQIQISILFSLVIFLNKDISISYSTYINQLFFFRILIFFSSYANRCII